MNIIQKLKDNIEAATGLPFLYGSRGEINRVLDSAPLPCAFAYLLETTGVDDINGVCHERLTMAVFFIDKTQFDFDAIENEDIIDRCKRTAFKWYVSNRRSEYFRFISINNTLRVYDELADAIVTGYALNVTIEEIEGISICSN